MMRLQRSHIVAISGQIVAPGAIVGGLEHGWSDLWTPTAVSGILVLCGSLVAALCAEPIQGRKVLTPEQRALARAARKP